MREIVPPKLNKDTGILSLILNRRNFLLFIGFTFSLLVWSTTGFGTVDQKILMELILGISLIPFLFDVNGRALHVFLIDAFKYLVSKKKQRVILGKDISEGIIIVSDYQFSKVFRIEPINLSMSSEEEIAVFKRYLQQALFALKNPIQILTIQKYSTRDKSFDEEINRYEKLSGKLQKQCKKYLLEYQSLTQTMERSFYLVLSCFSKGFDNAKRKLDEEENSFGKLLEQTKVKLIPLNTEEIKQLAELILPRNKHELV
ncbi:MAG: hypothetical protein JW870_04930 [Candidatus Delongbacteria bacterium]|nr:hypothetical protein [Candidatus Delongbacteria bacterium]